MKNNIMQVKGYTIENNAKWVRAVEGTLGRNGRLEGGVGVDASDEVKLAQYDSLGGLITKDSHKVKTGSFYNFADRKVREKPEVVFVFRDLKGEEVEVPEGKEVPMEVKAAEIQKDSKTAKKTAKKTK